MKKKFLSCLLVLCMMFSLLSITTVFASGIVDSGTCGEKLTWSLDSDGVLTISGTGDMTDAPWSNYQGNIKKVVFNEGVTSVCDEAFGAFSIEVIEFADSIKTIGNDAFYGTQIKELNLPSELISIGQWAFDNCQELKNVIAKDKLQEIKSGAFSNCSSLDTFDVPKSVTSISLNAFSNCTSLSEINVDDENQFYSSVDGVLYNKEKTELVLYIDRPDRRTFNVLASVEKIGFGTLSNCQNLNTITVEVGNKNFYSENGILFDKNDVIYAYPAGKTDTNYHFPDKVYNIGHYAFKGCKNLKEITLNNHIQEIGNGAFSNCINICNMSLPETVISVGEIAFSDCKSLKTINLPQSIEKIGGGAFDGCRSLETIKIPTKVSIIDYCTFRNCSSLKEIKIPLTVKKIGTQAFWQCSQLTDIVLNNNISIIASGAFYNCPISDVYYIGTKDEWDKITIENENDPLKNATIHYNYVCTNTSVTKEGETTKISVAPANAPIGTYILVGLYKNGRFIDVATAVYDGNDITVKTTKDFDNIKVMMWQNLQNLLPVCSPEEL